ncbi:hypothetical protein predicted by Glimmer/Critica [Bordetella petrii]|uniref:Uncharacterized protein n=1 Tax=Bordetella petrii (strain ATCC BAA-461 / DSM 12804 / CCUG 43448 / CIP 107267 / Se-1111R) TaxID=340100 RepID=A9IBG0_BORPD|nr:hypothetical protein predicted by Glimmer/Critica [Bordetella petrii]
MKESRDGLEKNPIDRREFYRDNPLFNSISTRAAETCAPSTATGYTFVPTSKASRPMSLNKSGTTLKTKSETTLKTRSAYCMLISPSWSEYCLKLDKYQIRFACDCMHGIFCEETAVDTNEEKTISTRARYPRRVPIEPPAPASCRPNRDVGGETNAIVAPHKVHLLS